MTDRKSHMGFPLTSRSMTLDDLWTALRSNFVEFSCDFAILGGSIVVFLCITAVWLFLISCSGRHLLTVNSGSVQMSDYVRPDSLLRVWRLNQDSFVLLYFALFVFFWVVFIFCIVAVLVCLLSPWPLFRGCNKAMSTIASHSTTKF